MEIQDVTATTILYSLIGAGLVHVRWSELRARLLGLTTVPCTLVLERTLVGKIVVALCVSGVASVFRTISKRIVVICTLVRLDKSSSAEYQPKHFRVQRVRRLCRSASDGGTLGRPRLTGEHAVVVAVPENVDAIDALLQDWLAFRSFFAVAENTYG